MAEKTDTEKTVDALKEYAAQLEKARQEQLVREQQQRILQALTERK